MEDTNYITKQQQDKEETKPSKFYSHLMYKSLIIFLFFIILPVFQSQSPEFLNQTRGWELLHLLFVGIAVSYCLFSRRNDETEKELQSMNNSTSKFDNADSMVSRFLQVSSVFDEEPESLSGFDDNKVQTWSNKYYRNEPSVIITQSPSVVSENQSDAVYGIEKALLLPVRSLKSRVIESEANRSEREVDVKSKSISRSTSNLGSKKFSVNSKKHKSGDDLVDKLEESDVFPSPIPWRSRSGRMEVKEEVPVSIESHARITEDKQKKQSFRLSSPPPPPPPPPPMVRNSFSVKQTQTPIIGKSVRTLRSVDNGNGNSKTEFDVDNVIVESDDSSDSETEEMDENETTECMGNSRNQETEVSSNDVVVSDGGGGGGGGPDVDKKADEFIAKFKEQIRLQRINSISKLSTSAQAMKSKSLSR